MFHQDDVYVVDDHLADEEDDRLYPFAERRRNAGAALFQLGMLVGRRHEHGREDRR